MPRRGSGPSCGEPPARPRFASHARHAPGCGPDSSTMSRYHRPHRGVPEHRGALRYRGRRAARRARPGLQAYVGNRKTGARPPIRHSSFIGADPVATARRLRSLERRASSDWQRCARNRPRAAPRDRGRGHLPSATSDAARSSASESHRQGAAVAGQLHTFLAGRDAMRERRRAKPDGSALRASPRPTWPPAPDEPPARTLTPLPGPTLPRRLRVSTIRLTPFPRPSRHSSARLDS